MDTEAIAFRRRRFTDTPMAQRPPFILRGSYLAAMNYWHGAIENEWANNWVDYWTDGQGEFVASAMEGSGMMIALKFLEQAKFSRLLKGYDASSEQLYDAVARRDCNREQIGRS